VALLPTGRENSFVLIHTVFDILAWLTSLTTLLCLRRTWFASALVTETLRAGYIAAVLLGAGLGAWIFGSANLWLSGIHEPARSIEGALAGAILAVEIYKRRAGVRLRTGAIYALPVALGIAVGRIGCLLSGMEDQTYGLPTGASWGWDFGDGINRHPVALYESIAMLVFAAIYVHRVSNGSTFWRVDGFYLCVAFYGIERFILEFYKPYASLIAGLSLFQCLSILLAAYGLAMLTERPWPRKSTAGNTG
jgi:prolipoprotein diacylglyceryltransferase